MIEPRSWPEKKPAFVLDSYALLAYFQAEQGALKVKELLHQAREGTVAVFLSLINLGEIAYTVERRLGGDTLQQRLLDIAALPIDVCAVNKERVLAAAHLQAAFPISYADAFAAALAQEMGAPLVTSDPEFKHLQPLVAILWI